MIGHLDCSTGVSGDKFLGALLDIGERIGGFGVRDLEEVARRLAPEARVLTERVDSHGISAIGVRVEAAAQPPSRSWSDIRGLLQRAALPEPVHARARAAFELLAEAEAAAHGTAADEVHFHEVGALDSIVDVVGVCAGIEALGVKRLVATPPATGWGSVATSHGMLMVPAPATAALLLGVPVVPGAARPDGSAPGELTTPTGAALLRALCASFGPLPPSVPRHIGYGAGTREIGAPNVCRLLLAEPAELHAGLSSEAVSVLESNIDHISGEAVSFASEELLAEGALDVWSTPALMKRGRPAFTLSALVPTTEAERFAERVIALTGSLGVRRMDVERFVAPREERTLETPYGPVRFKIGAGRLRPEAVDVARLARELSRPYSAIDEELRAHARRVLPPGY